MATHIGRREFISTLGGAAAWPFAACGQQTMVPVIGFLGPGSAQSDSYRVTAFRQGLSEAGLVEGRNFTIAFRWADSHYDRLPAFAIELVQQQMAVIATSSTPATLAAKAATTTIPIVFETAANPVYSRLSEVLRTSDAQFWPLFSLAFFRDLSKCPTDFDNFVRALAMAASARASCSTLRV